MASLVEVESDEAFNRLVTGASPSTLLVLYFKAEWAAPCAQMSTILSTLASTYPADSSISFLAIDAENLPDVSESYDVTSVPYVVLQKDGKQVETISGSDATKVRAAVEKHASTKAGTTVPPVLEATAPATNGTQPDDGKTSEELNTRLANLVKAQPVMLFMKGTPNQPQCGFSRQMVGILRENGVKYGFFNILADDEVRQGLKEFSDWPTFPQLYMQGELVGGLDIVKEEMESNTDFFKEFSVKSEA